MSIQNNFSLEIKKFELLHSVHDRKETPVYRQILAEIERARTQLESFLPNVSTKILQNSSRMDVIEISCEVPDVAYKSSP